MSEINLEIENKELSQKNSILILIGSILLGTLFNTLFYGKLPAISVLIFVIAFYILFFIIFRAKLVIDFSMRNVLILFILLLSATYSIYTNPMFMLFNIFAIFLLMVVHTILIANKNKHNWYDYRFLHDLANGIFHDAFVYTLKPVKMISDLINIKLKINNSEHTTFKKVILGLLISLPLLFIVIGLLSSADAVFENLIDVIPNILKNININSFLIQLIIIIVISLLVFSYIWSLSIKRSNENASSSMDKYTHNNFFDPVIVITILIMICLVYSLFTFIQFTYLFGSLSHVLPKNITYAAYARRGFWELVAVTLINLTILLTNINLTDKTNNKTNIPIRFLNCFLIFCTVIMLFSAHFRMSLYEKVYGYTYLRFFTHTFMLYIFVLLLIVFVKVWYEKLSLAKHYLIISLIAYTLLNFSNVDSFIANKNIERYHETGKLDIYYLSNLSYEAVPQMVKLLPELKHKDPISATKLENQLFTYKNQLRRWNHWQSFNFSIVKTKNLLSHYNFKYDNATRTSELHE